MVRSCFVFFLGLAVTATAITLPAASARRDRVTISDGHLGRLRGSAGPLWCRDATPANQMCMGESETEKTGVCGVQKEYVYRERCSNQFGNEYCSTMVQVPSIHSYTSTRCKWKRQGIAGNWFCQLDPDANPATCCEALPLTDDTTCAYTARDPAQCHAQVNCDNGAVP